MKKLTIFSCLVVGMISIAATAETIVGDIAEDAAKTTGAVAGAAIGTGTGAVDGAEGALGELLNVLEKEP